MDKKEFNLKTTNLLDKLKELKKIKGVVPVISNIKSKIRYANKYWQTDRNIELIYKEAEKIYNDIINK